MGATRYGIRHRLVSGALVLVLAMSLVISLGSCAANDGTASPQERTVHVSGIACSEQREGVGVDLGTGMILTSGHVVAGLSKATVRAQTGENIRAEVVHIDERLDVAVLAVETWLNGAVVIADIAAGETGTVHLRDPDGVITSFEFTVDRRIRAQTLNVSRSEEVERPSLQLTATLQRGDSGAALWDDEDRVVGVLWAISTSVAARAFAVQGDELEAVLRAADQAPSGPSRC